MRRALTIVELLVVLASMVLMLAALVPSLSRLRSGGAEGMSVANLQTLSYAHAMYAWDWSDRQVTWVPDDAGVYTSQSGQTNWYVAYLAGGGGCPPQLLVGWDDDSFPNAWGWFLPCSGYGGSSSSASTYQPSSWGGLGSLGWGSFRLPNVVAFHNYVDGRFYSETFYAPADTKTWELASYGFSFDASFTVPPPLGQGGLPSFVPSSYCLSPAAMWGPEVFSRNERTGGWFTPPWTSPTGYQSPTVSQCTYPDLKTRMLEHNWNVGQPTDVNAAFIGKFTPYFFNQGMAAAPVTMYFDGHVDIVPNAKVFADDAAVLAGTRGVVGLWTRDTPMGPKGYFGEQSYDGTVLSHHVLTTEGILGRDVLNTMASQGLDGKSHGTRKARDERAAQAAGGAAKQPVRPPGEDPIAVPW